MHIATKMASSHWSARKEYSPQGNSQAPRQAQNKSCTMSNIPSKRTTNSATAKSSTTGLSTRPIAVAATRFRPLSESHPRHCRNTFADDDDYNDHDVGTPSLWLSLFFCCLRKAWKHLVGNCTFSVEQSAFSVEECAFLATSLVGKLLLLRFFFGCAERSRGRFSQFCGTVAHFASNDDPQWGAVTDEVVELQPSFEHLPPLLKPCFPVALRKMLIYDMGGGTFGASPF